MLGVNMFDMDIRSCDEGSQQSWRKLDLYQGSPESSKYSTGSTVLSQMIEKIDGKNIVTPDSNLCLIKQM